MSQQIPSKYISGSMSFVSTTRRIPVGMYVSVDVSTIEGLGPQVNKFEQVFE